MIFPDHLSNRNLQFRYTIYEPLRLQGLAVKVPIVNDSNDMQMIIQRTLKHAGFANIQPLEASNGIEALRVIVQHSPDLVLSGWNSAERKGIELLQTLRAKGKQVPLGFITSDINPEIRQQAETTESAFAIVKPFTPIEFDQALKLLMA